TFSMVAIPIVLAVGGWTIQEELQDKTLNRDYVQLAVSILKEPKDAAKIDPEMRTWAVQLLNDNSPTHFNSTVFEQLKSGEAALPASFTVSQPAASTAAAGLGGPRDQAPDLEAKGFQYILQKDADAALQAFTEAEKLWPTYHNVTEIRRLLKQNHDELAKAPKGEKSVAWSNLYSALLGPYKWGIPPEVLSRLAEQK